MTECSRLLPHHHKTKLPDLEVAEKENDGKHEQEQPSRRSRRSWMLVILAVTCLAVVWSFYKPTAAFSRDSENKKMVAKANNNNNDAPQELQTTPSTDTSLSTASGTAAPVTTTEDTHNIEFPTQPVFHSNKVSVDDAYAISFADKTNKTMTTTTTKRTSNVPVEKSYQIDNPAMAVSPAGKLCHNHFECTSRACGLETWKSGALLVCCTATSALWTLLPDGTYGFVCTRQEVGSPCNQNVMCASGQCLHGTCQEA